MRNAIGSRMKRRRFSAAEITRARRAAAAVLNTTPGSIRVVPAGPRGRRPQRSDEDIKRAFDATDGDTLAMAKILGISQRVVQYQLQRITVPTKTSTPKVTEEDLVVRPGDTPATQLIKKLRATGMSIRAIGAALEARGLRTVRGNTKWWPASIYAALGVRW